MMEEKLVSCNLAKLAKQKGFQELCFYYYDQNGILKEPYTENGSSTDTDFKVELTDLLENWNNKHIIRKCYSAPTQSLLQKWLREVHKINVESNYLPNIEKYSCLYIPMTGKALFNDTKYVSKIRFNSYEEALELGLFEALQLLPDKV